MQHIHIPHVPAALNHNSAGPRHTNVGAPNNSPAVHTSKSNNAWLTYPDTPARIVLQQSPDPAAASTRITPQHEPARNESTVESHTRKLFHVPGSTQSGNIAQASNSRYHLGPSNSSEKSMGSSLGPTGGWSFGGGVRGQLGGLSAEARTEKFKRELFRDALFFIRRMDAEKASDLKGRWEREFGSL